MPVRRGRGLVTSLPGPPPAAAAAAGPPGGQTRRGPDSLAAAACHWQYQWARAAVGQRFGIPAGPGVRRNPRPWHWPGMAMPRSRASGPASGSPSPRPWHCQCTLAAHPNDLRATDCATQCDRDSDGLPECPAVTRDHRTELRLSARAPYGLGAPVTPAVTVTVRTARALAGPLVASGPGLTRPALAGRLGRNSKIKFKKKWLYRIHISDQRKIQCEHASWFSKPL